MTDTHPMFTQDDLWLIKRVLKFATVDIPVSDGQGNSLYPTLATQKHAQDLVDMLDEKTGPHDKPGMYIAFNPEELQDKTVQIWQIRDNGYTHQMRGPVTDVQGSDIEGWIVVLDEYVFGPFSREELKKSCQVEMNIP